MSVPAKPVGSASSSTLGVRWVFLDRDGTLNVKPPNGEYVELPEALELLPGAAQAVKMLNRAGLWTGVVTNQRGVALGRMSTEDLDAVHERLEYLLHRQGAFLEAIYACPHEIGVCNCRKPGPGLLLEARREQPALAFEDAAIVGDSLSDMQAGRSLGLRTVLVGQEGAGNAAVRLADHVVADLLEAARLLIG
ncbi:MAG TPA: HAD family hydrolase [Solirubrobacteraceae bacterium]|jgi:D-glycero-D-manno-heptose 1,7-bisphosphate phosphatase|nr:HAD family hydrolase [Solirubrobacteraceae bacterium]